MFDINQYNQLPSITTASAAFNSKLASSGLTVDTLLEKLRPLFCSDEHNGKYGVWLLHHHFDLEEGERMVKKGAISEPTMDQSPTIVVERWSSGGDELEHVYVENPDDFPPPPPPAFIEEFQKITSADNMDCLGICYAPSVDEMKMMDSGYMLLGPGDLPSGP